MIALLVVAVTWLVLLAVVVGMLHIATSTPTPRPGTATPLTLIGHERGAPDRRTRLEQSPPGLAPTPLDAA